MPNKLNVFAVTTSFADFHNIILPYRKVFVKGKKAKNNVFGGEIVLITKCLRHLRLLAIILIELNIA